MLPTPTFLLSPNSLVFNCIILACNSSVELMAWLSAASSPTLPTTLARIQDKMLLGAPFA